MDVLEPGARERVAVRVAGFSARTRRSVRLAVLPVRELVRGGSVPVRAPDAHLSVRLVLAPRSPPVFDDAWAEVVFVLEGPAA